MPPFYETESPRRWFFGVWGWIIAVLVAGAITSTVLFATGTVAAPWVGRANAYRQQQSSTNRIFAQQYFFELYTEYQATVAKIPVYRAQAATGDQVAQVNLTGLVSHCMEVVAKYNAASSEYLTKDFKDANLPTSIALTSCQ